MKTYEVRNEGRLVGFEISSWVGRWRASRAARDVPGAEIVRWPKRWGWDHDEFCEFDVDGERFLIIERFGESSRYWIVSDPPAEEACVLKVRASFESARAIDWRYGKGKRRDDGTLAY